MSANAIALLAAAIAFTVAFVFVELRAEEPIIPMRLFRNPIFTVGNIFGFLIGFAMFGGAIYLPLYLHTVQGMSPTRSGLGLLPMVLGVFSMSIGSGLLITKTGRYNIFPILGAAILAGALFLLSTIEVDSPYWLVAIYAYLFGTGLGLAMMTIVTPIQNAVEMRDMGAATSSTTFGRSLGGAIGAAMFGAILTSRLSVYLAQELNGGTGAATTGGEISTNNIQAIQALPQPLKTEVLTAYTHAITDVFLLAIPIIIVALIVVFFLKEIPLRSGQLTAAPATTDKAEQHVDSNVPAFSGH